MSARVSEHQHQVALFTWAALHKGRIPALKQLFAVPNGAKLPWKRTKTGRRYSAEALKLQREGLTPGVPDIFLAYPASGYCGLFIELKAGRNKVTKTQQQFMAGLETVGYKCAVCYGSDEAKEEILFYLGRKVLKDV